MSDLLPTLRAALSGDGPALLPHPAKKEPPSALGPGLPLAEDEDNPHDPTVAVVSTSGSTGTPKGALLPASALLASASATHDRLGGAGRWLLALPAHHVAGLQVLLRSLISGTVPAVLDLSEGFRAEAFAEAARSVTGGRLRAYTSLVPTQLGRLLDAGPDVVSSLTGFAAVLLGGAPAPRSLLARAADAGVRVVTTYGSSETCGGCVYDGRPLDGTRIRVDEDGRIRLGGPTVARGYRGGDVAGAFSTDAGARWFRTDDAGHLDADGTLTFLARLDDMIVTGGLKVAPAVVEEALLAVEGVAEAVVVGVTDPVWGQRVVAAVVPARGRRPPTLDDLRREVTRRAGPHAAPRQLIVLERLPLRGPGKPDRTGIAKLASRSI